MIALVTIVIAEERDGGPKMLFAQKDQATQTLLFDCANESFSIGVALRNTRRAKDDFNAGRFESLPKAINVLGIAVDNQVRLAEGEAVHGGSTGSPIWASATAGH